MDRLVTQYNDSRGDRVENESCDSSDESTSDPLVGSKTTKMFVDNEDVSKAFEGEIVSSRRVNREHLYYIVYDDGDSEELCRSQRGFDTHSWWEILRR